MGKGEGRGRAENLCENIARTVLAVLNVISMFLSIVIMSVGSYGVSSSKELTDRSPLLANLGTKGLATALVIVGLSMAGLAAVGFVAAWKKWKKVLTLYALIAFLGCIVQISLGAFLLKARSDDYLDNVIGEVRWGHQTEEARQAFQDSFPCCGWATTRVPFCHSRNASCRDALSEYIGTHLMPLANAAISIGVLQLVSLFVSCFVIFQSKETTDDFYTNPFAY